MESGLDVQPRLTRREFLRRSALTSGLVAVQSTALSHLSGSAAEIGQEKPNIVLIVADDLGYGELGCQGNSEIPTPNIDSIAKNGVRFTQGYTSAPLCSPSRAGLLTGRYQQRFGHEFNPAKPVRQGDVFGLPLSETPLPVHLKNAGYATGMVGKWHLGDDPEYLPLKRGFDEFYGFLGGGHSYIGNSKGKGSLLRGSVPISEDEYLTDAFAREAEAFVERHRAKPFFLYMPFNAVHMPLQASAKYLDRVGHIKEEKRRTYAAMTIAMDEAVGRVLAKLRRHQLTERTLVVFISDNGGPTLATTSSNGSLRGYKAQVYEGGIRLPFMMQWKGRIPAGKIYEQPVISLDILPTALAAAGVTVRNELNLDGVDLIPYVAGSASGRPHETLFWRMGEKRAVRHGDWKLVRELGNTDWSLYNLAEDAGELKNLAESNSAKVEELKQVYGAWDSQMAEPKWIRDEGRRQRLQNTGGTNPSVSESQVERRFKQLDGNGDGILSAEEVRNAPRYRGADLNKDGRITIEEAKKSILKK